MAEPTLTQEEIDARKSPEQLENERLEAIHTKRMAEIDGKKKLSDDEKEVLKQYDAGVQIFQIAKNVYKFVNNDTVGSVILTIRREHAEDFNEVEDINSTRGYSGV